MNIIIRQENAKDFTAIYDLVKTAFETAKVTNGKEQDFVNELRNGSGYISQLALVAEEHENLIGHIMFTTTYIVNGDARAATLLLAPLSVALAYRNKGIGSRLINEGFRLARELGYNSVFLVGDPGYYHRFGFKASVNFGITNSAAIPDEYVMACELVANALLETKGIIKW
ncbi:acyl-coa n-acyltransferase [Lucifera butyrica]|uniref:Acyl-coa n-acyltransferase n=1 Tax=Lucifera butyrica TaxID=1351585 RepID=A0A498REX8_9FIRM|nr:N-acetyltransferase [Lucifera butyrica]VBB09497.1 acyl-coa n-acyltransferase [Lucifera butyrica]